MVARRSLRQLACDMAEAGYMPSRNASKNTTSKEADLTYGRLVAYIQPKNGHYNDVTWDEFYGAIKSCKWKWQIMCPKEIFWICIWVVPIRLKSSIMGVSSCLL